MTEQVIRICLRLDNGDTIRGSVGDAKRTARLVGIRQQIEAGELSTDAQKKRLDDIAQIYQRLHEPVNAQKRRFDTLQVCSIAAPFRTMRLQVLRAPLLYKRPCTFKGA
jgi:hypothetical protein